MLDSGKMIRYFYALIDSFDGLVSDDVAVDEDQKVTVKDHYSFFTYLDDAFNSSSVIADYALDVLPIGNHQYLFSIALKNHSDYLTTFAYLVKEAK